MTQEHDWPSSPESTPTGNAYSVSQARLDRIPNPTGNRYYSMVRWINRFYSPEWTPAKQTERRHAMSRDAAQLQALLNTPPPDWDGQKWTKMKDRLEEWEGQMDALDFHAQKRNWKGGPSPR